MKPPKPTAAQAKAHDDVRQELPTAQPENGANPQPEAVPGSRARVGSLTIPPDRADGSSSWVHVALILTGKLGQVSPLLALPLGLALVALASWPLGWPAALLHLAFLASDGAMLALLPVRGRSWGPVTPSWLALTLARAVLARLVAWLVPEGAALFVLGGLQAAIGAAAIYATWIEPFRVGMTRQSWHTAPAGGSATAQSNGASLRVLHISDVHFEGPSPREAKLLELVARAQADLIVLTGDYLNLSSVYDPAAQQGVRALLAQLHAPLGVYAVTGSPVVDVAGIVPEIFAGLDIRWLNDEAIRVPLESGELWLLGVRTTYDEARDAEALARLARATPQHAKRVLLYHTPDLMPRAAGLGLDLYLCGHTHGGQIRLPLYGAVATSSRWGKRYEMGRYQQRDTTLYVSRGLGLEGLGAPRARFLAPPEVVLWKWVW